MGGTAGRDGFVHEFSDNNTFILLGGGVPNCHFLVVVEATRSISTRKRFISLEVTVFKLCR